MTLFPAPHPQGASRDVVKSPNYEVVVGPDVVESEPRQSAVAIDAAAKQAAAAFEFVFDGKTKTDIFVPRCGGRHAALFAKSGAVVGPSGSGKTTALEALVRESRRSGAEVIEASQEEQKAGGGGGWPRDRTAFSVVVEAFAGASSSAAPLAGGGASGIFVDLPLDRRTELAKGICAACGLNGQTLLKPFYVVSSSEQHAFVVARLLAQARSYSERYPNETTTVIVDEFIGTGKGWLIRTGPVSDRTQPMSQTGFRPVSPPP